MWSNKNVTEVLPMRKSIFSCLVVATLLMMVLPTGADEVFDGTRPLLCATIEAIDCAPGEQCERGLPEIVGAPQFMRIDFAKKEVVGPKRSSEILLMHKNDEQLTLQGYELDMGWTLAIDRNTGRMTVTFAGGESAFLIFGACTPLP
jgi:hypothetical protein